MLKEKKLPRNCSACGTNRWTLSNEMYLLSAFSSGAIVLGSGLPCVALVCRNCGHTQLYNVFVAGLSEILEVSQKNGGAT